MIISERKGFIFVHNPKCAGTSVRSALTPYDTTHDLFWNFETWNGREIDRAHMPLFMFRSLYPQYFALLSHYLSFMFVRDPYDRAVSAFNEVRRMLVPTSGEPGSEKNYRQALNSFLANMTEKSLRREMRKYRHFVRQSDMAFLGQKRLVDIVMKIEEWPDCLSQLAVFMPDVAARIAQAEKRNVTRMPNRHKSYLDEVSIGKINTIYEQDFDLFGYSRITAPQPAALATEQPAEEAELEV